MSAIDEELPQPTSMRAHNRGRVPGLDGLRAVAVLAVMLFHTASEPLQGGFLGVDVFFVLSGFLIAGILFDELGRTDKIALTHFWLRRARRLAPALLLLLVTVGVARIAVPHEDPGSWRGAMLAALTYTSNWFQIATGADYFSSFGQAQPLMHTWSLAIEEQFYLVFALLVALLLKHAASRTVLAVFLVLTLMSSSWMAFSALSDPVLAYYGTFARIQALLIGAMLAVHVRRARNTWPLTGGVWRGPASCIGVLILTTAFVISIPTEVMFRGGFLVVSVAAAAIIWGILGGGRLSAALSWRPLVALGTISYGMYLWHWPIFLILGTDNDASGYTKQAWAFVLTVVVAAISYIAVERPVRQGRFLKLDTARQWSAYAAAAAAIALLAMLPARTLPEDPDVVWPNASTVPSRIMVAGDSTMLRLAMFFPHKEYPEVTVGGPLRIGCGVVDVAYVRDGAVQTTEKCGGWQSEWRQKAEDTTPEVVVMGSIVWDAFDRFIGGSTYGPGTVQFDESFDRAYREAISSAGGDGQIPVYVLGQPCLASPNPSDVPLNDPERSAKLDQLIRSVVQGMPNARYVDTRAMTCTADGMAADSASRQPLREDGVHWNRRGADMLWSTVLAQIAKE